MTGRPGTGIYTRSPVDEELAAVRSLHIERSTTAERVSEGLRQLIILGQLKPGSVLREATLVEALGISRNSLREAFRLLSRDRLVVHQLHRGVEVRRLTAADISDIYRTRVVLQVSGIEHSAGQPPERLDPIREAAASGRAAVKRRDWEAAATSDIVFHQRIVALIGSARIDALFQSVLAELRLAFAMPHDQAALLTPYAARNEAIWRMLKRGDIGAAVEEMRSYLADAERQLLASI